MTELFEKSIRVLELPQLLERLSQKAVSTAAKERAAHLVPLTDVDDVRRRRTRRTRRAPSSDCAAAHRFPA